MIVDYIDSHRESMGVEPICTVLTEAGVPIAPSTYYAHRAAPVTPAALEQAYLINALIDLWRANWCVYGARKLWRAALRADLHVGRDQVARLMAIGGITGAVRGRHRTRTTQRDEQAARHPDLVGRGWNRPTGLDQLWVADFSYVWTLTGFVYVAFVVDVHSRRILGWRVTADKRASLVTDALRQALDVRERGHFRWCATGLICHSDAGSQGGFNWSSQHLDVEGVGDGSERQGPEHEGRATGVAAPVACRSSVAPTDAFPWAPTPVTFAASRTAVLAPDRHGRHNGGSLPRGRRVVPRRCALVSTRWRHATDQPGRAVRALSQFRRT